MLDFFPCWAVDKSPSIRAASDVCKGKNIGFISCCSLPAPVGSSEGYLHYPPLSCWSAGPLTIASASSATRQVQGSVSQMFIRVRDNLSAAESPPGYGQWAAQSLHSGPLGKPGVTSEPLQTLCVQLICNGILTDGINEASLICSWIAILHWQNATPGLCLHCMQGHNELGRIAISPTQVWVQFYHKKLTEKPHQHTPEPSWGRACCIIDFKRVGGWKCA